MHIFIQVVQIANRIQAYTIAVLLEDVPPVWPYISDTGTFPPEACIFGQLLNTGAILMAMVTYLRYRHVAEALTTQTIVKIRRLNVYSLWFGFIASLGVSVVGNFQETNMFSLHIIGAGMAFGCGTVYQVLQTRISWKIYPLMGTKSTNITRIFLAAICSITAILTFIFAVISFSQFEGTDITKWTKDQKGYKEHLFSAVNEWITAVCTMAFILTFADELRYVKVIEPEILLTKRHNSTPEGSRY